MKPQTAINNLIDNLEIMHEDMLDIMRQIMRGELSEALISALIIGLRVKGETVGEITAAAQVMREFSTKVSVQDDLRLVDTCGTGGDSLATFNISTAAAFVASATGAKVAKHGGRSVSSKSGSADVLEALGINLDLSADQVASCIDEVGFGFMYAPNHHSAMRYAAPVRRELGVRTLFNILGPLTNPAQAKNQLMGVFHPDLVPIQANVLRRLASERVLVVHGRDGLDEISISGETLAAELIDGEVTEYIIHPSRFGLNAAPLADIQVDGAESARKMFMEVLEGRAGPAADVVALNAGAAIYVSGIAKDLEEGVSVAQDAIMSGAALVKLQELVNKTNSFRGG